MLRSKGTCGISLKEVNCDYYEFLKGNTAAICAFQGDIITDYSWAEPVIFELHEKKQQFYSQPLEEALPISSTKC